MSEHDVCITGTVQDAVNDILREDSYESRDYLKERFLTAAILALFEARKAAGLTQVDLAERLGTKQPAISNLEADFSGSFSFRRYIDYLLACNRLPLDLTIAPVGEIRHFLLAHPDEMPTVSAYSTWHEAQSANAKLPTTAQVAMEGTVSVTDWRGLAVRALTESGNSVRYQPQSQGSSSVGTQAA